MSSISFCTTPKGDLPQYLFILMNMDPLVTELNDAACYRLGTMLYLYIQNRKDVMKSSGFQQYIGGEYACMKIIIQADKWFGRP